MAIVPRATLSMRKITNMGLLNLQICFLLFLTANQMMVVASCYAAGYSSLLRQSAGQTSAATTYNLNNKDCVKSSCQKPSQDIV